MNIAPTRYTKTAVILHWLIALGIFGMFALGWFMSDIPKEAPKQMMFDLFNWGIFNWPVAEEISPRSFYFNVHKSFGVTIFSLILLRTLWRLTHTPPVLLSSYKAIERKLASVSHRLLYVLMLVLPLTGVIMAVYSKYGIKWFGMPFISGLDNNPMRLIFKEAHEIIGLVLLVIVVVHILGALKHQLVDKDKTLNRML